MEYKMKLTYRNYMLIHEKIKVIEMRLNDKKRQKIKVGDLIEFTELEYGFKLSVKVVQINKYKNFDELYKNFEKRKLGYLYFEKADSTDMLQYYTEEQQKKYGVLAIEIKTINIEGEE